MKKSGFIQIISTLLTLVAVIGLIYVSALTVHAGHVCENCDEWIDGSPYCEDCYECAECCELCLECGKCSDCSGWEICEDCADEESAPMCVDCAIDKGYHCNDCYDCYMKEQTWCDECGRCKSCVEICDACSQNLGKGVLCVECALDEGGHCPDCNECYFEVGSWCEECLLCDNCSAICEGCSETESAIICANCAIDAGMHCPDCSECYDESNWEYCTDCGVCANCREYCDDYELCMDCAVEGGYHCSSCEGCCEDDPICESCGDACGGCADDFCESCGMCSDCVQVCPSCGACSNCAEICPNCGEYCSDCEDICDDCEYCMVCCADMAAFEGCDCSDWICVENGAWQEHFEEEHIYTFQDGHISRPAKSWSWDDTWHWQMCLYCDDSAHHSNKFAHTYDKRGMCTVCCYAQDSNIQILQQPVDVQHVNVQSPYEDCDNSNIAHFSVKAVGKSELTYTWYRKTNISINQWEYVPLTDPAPGEVFDGPDLYVLASTSSCYEPDYFCCIILDEEGNQARTVEVMLSARHHYQYFKYWKGDYPSDPYETAGRAQNYHNLQCVGEGCEKTSTVRPHEDDDGNDECDICRREMPEILITEQPKSVKSVLVTSSDEYPLESNYATFSVKAEGKSKLTYTWCRRYYTAPGQWYYEPLTNPEEGEVYDAPTARILAPGDACTSTYYYCCIITDEEGNQAQTIEVSLKGKHNYQYYKYYKSQTNPLPGTKRKEVGHVAMCVGDGCGKMTRLSHHIDVDKNFCCDICYYIKRIDELELKVTVPLAGQKPDYDMTLDSPICFIRGNASLTYRRWYVSDNGTDGWQLMDKNATFLAGKYYKVSVDLGTVDEREFATYTNSNLAGGIVHEVFVWMNDRRGTMKQTGNLSLADYGTAEYVYLCESKKIPTITIEGLDSPITGQKPDYAVTLDDSGYKLDVGATTYRKNGVMWKQYGLTDAMNVNSKFVAGKSYYCYITLVADEYHTFASDATVTINGKTATLELYDSNRTAVVSYLYDTTPPAQIREINLTEVNLPWEGAEADWNVNLNSDLFYADEMSWVDLTLNEGHYGEFVAGHQYLLGMMLATNTVDGIFQCAFDENVLVTVNGRPATVIAVDWDGWTGSYVYFEFLCPSTGEKVKLVDQPVSVEVDQGQKATVTVDATGTDLTYTWYYKNKGSSKFSKTTAFTGATYSVEMNESRDGRQLYCVVTDGGGNVVTSNTVTISMKKPALAITTQPKNIFVAEGQTAKLIVVATGNGLKYQWQYRTSSTGSWQNVSAASGKTANYSLTAQSRHSGYQYRCKITDSAENKVYTNTVNLYVLSITTQPTTQKVKADATAKFTVSATGANKTYQWQYRTSSTGSWQNVSAASGKTASYSLTAQSRHNGYYYRCCVKDSAGNTVYSKTVRLYVLAIKTQPVSKTVVAGKTAKFTVSATGNALKYQWQYRTSSSGSWKNVSAASGKTANYSLTAESRHHGYQYRCKITDSAGNTVYTETVSLYVLGIKTQPVSKSVKVGATAKFTVSAVGKGLKYQWYYRTSSSGSWKAVSAASGKTANYSMTAQSRHNGYQYRCKITDSAGNVIYTNVVQLTVK